ncbi:MAG: sigma-70 family RNA polymerase sigma factor [Archangiaceae bacterium]|nr:sigma-70 family RNA polymerase sigma factor [Archangiaceae bacterium]
MNSIVASADELTPTAWAGLIRRYDHAVFLSLLSAGLTPRAARELCHDTWARLYEQWRAGRLDVLQLPGLAITQAKFLALEEHRRRARVAPIGEETLQRADPRASPEDRAVARQLVDQVEQALERCPPRARALFELALANPDTPHAALAEQSGISLQRLRQALCEVRARLRLAVKETP